MIKLLEEWTMGASVVRLESDHIVNEKGYLLRRYRVSSWQGKPLRLIVKWRGGNDINAAHRGYVVAIESVQGKYAAEIEARKLRAKQRSYARGYGLGDLIQGIKTCDSSRARRHYTKGVKT